VTSYDYKLSSLILVDQSNRSRAAFCCLSLHEGTIQCPAYLADYHRATGMKFPSLVLTDDCPAMEAAILSMPYDVSHMLCLWHLVDENMRWNMQAAIEGGTSTWPAFRHGLKIVRDAQGEERFDALWQSLLEKWIPRGVRTAKALKYMLRMYESRSKWASFCFCDAVTLGAMSTQRSEGWHDLLKRVTKPSSTLTEIKNDLLYLSARQVEQQTKDSSSAA
jgi:hypothetical protein